MSPDPSTAWRYIPFGTYSGAENMAIDEYFLNTVGNKTSPNVLRFYKWAPSTATIGRNQSLNAEIDIQAAEKEGMDVIRRISGGGAVFHDGTGEITYAIICRLKDLPIITSDTREYDDSIPARYHSILEALAAGLEQFGVSIDIGKIHCPALLSHGKKLSGNAQALRKNVLLQHGTILLTVNPELMYRILRAPEGVAYTKMVRSVRAKVTGIESELPQETIDESRLIECLRTGFEKIFLNTLISQPLSRKEWGEIKQLAAEKYANPAWLNKFP